MNQTDHPHQGADTAMQDEQRTTRGIIVADLTNAYYEGYRYERPNDSTEKLIAFCRDLAENDVDELINQALATQLKSLMEQSKIYTSIPEGQATFEAVPLSILQAEYNRLTGGSDNG